MGVFTKKDAIRIVVDCAEKYRDNLLDRSLLFILTDKNKYTSYLEVSFRASNFMHLTGLKIPELTSGDETENKDFVEKPLGKISAREFFNRCLKHELSENDFELADDGTTELKLDILPKMMKPNLNANMVGIYDNSMSMLYTEKLAGGVNGCMGFCKDSKTHWMIPNTILKKDIRDLTKGRFRIIATYRKKKDEDLYSECVYLAKKVDWSKIKYPYKYKYIPVPVEQVKNIESVDKLSVSKGTIASPYTKEQISIIEAYTSSVATLVNYQSKNIEDIVDQLQVPVELREEVIKRLKY